MIRELQLPSRILDIAKSFDLYVEKPTETTRLISCIDDLQQVGSLLKLLGWDAAALLVDKIQLSSQALLQTSVSGNTLFCQDLQQVYACLQSSLAALSASLEISHEESCLIIDQHCQCLASLTSDRLSIDINGQQDPQSPRQYSLQPTLYLTTSPRVPDFKPLASHAKTLSNRHLQALEQREMRTWLRKTRHLLQAGTLQLLRDDDVASASKRLQLCFSQLNRGCGYTQHGIVWLPALIFAEWLQNQTKLPATIRSILRQLDLHLKEVADGCLEHLNRPPSPLLLQQLLFYPQTAPNNKVALDKRLATRMTDSEQFIDKTLTVANTLGLIMDGVDQVRRELRLLDSLTTAARQKCRQLAECLQGCIDLAQLMNQGAIEVLCLQQQRQLRRLSVSGEKDFQAYQPTCLLVMDQLIHRLQFLTEYPGDLAAVVFHKHSQAMRQAYQQIGCLQSELINLGGQNAEQRSLSLLMGHLQQLEMTLIHLKIPRLTACVAALSNTLQQLRMEVRLPLIPFYQAWGELFCSVHFVLDRLLLGGESDSTSDCAIGVQQEGARSIQRVEQAFAILNAEAGISPSLAMDERESDESDLLALIAQEFDEQLEILRRQWLIYCDTQQSSPLSAMRLAFHTVKGSSRVLGAHQMADLAWSAEEICTRMLEDCYDMTPDLTAVIEDSIHWIAQLIQHTQQGTEPDAALVQAIESGREIISHWLDHCFELNITDILTNESLPAIESDVSDQDAHSKNSNINEGPRSFEKLGSIAVLQSASQASVSDTSDREPPSASSATVEIEQGPCDLIADLKSLREVLQNFIRQSWRDNFSNSIPPVLIRAMEQFCLTASSVSLPQFSDLALQVQQMVIMTPADANKSDLTDLLARYEQFLLEVSSWFKEDAAPDRSEAVPNLLHHQQTLQQDIQRYIADRQEQIRPATRVAPVDLETEIVASGPPNNTSIAVNSHDQVLNQLIEVDALLGHWLQTSNIDDLKQINSHLTKVLELTSSDDLLAVNQLTQALHEFFDRLIHAPAFDSAVNGTPVPLQEQTIALASASHDALLNMMDQAVAGHSLPTHSDCIQALNNWVLSDSLTELDCITEAPNTPAEVSTESVEVSVEAPVKAPFATLEDTALEKTQLTLPNIISVDQEHEVVMAIFLEEAEEIAESMDQSLSEWQDAPNNSVAIEELQSAAATLASGANMAQLDDLESLCIALERLYRMVIKADVTMDNSFFRLLQRSQDLINRALTDLTNHRDLSLDQQAREIITQLDQRVATMGVSSILLDEQQPMADAANDGSIDQRERLSGDTVKSQHIRAVTEIDHLITETDTITELVNQLKVVLRTIGNRERNEKSSDMSLMSDKPEANIVQSLLGLQARLRQHAHQALDDLNQ